jgi:hypothetical protein
MAFQMRFAESLASSTWPVRTASEVPRARGERIDRIWIGEVSDLDAVTAATLAAVRTGAPFAEVASH